MPKGCKECYEHGKKGESMRGKKMHELMERAPKKGAKAPPKKGK